MGRLIVVSTKMGLRQMDALSPCRGSAGILCLQRPGRWPLGRVGEGLAFDLPGLWSQSILADPWRSDGVTCVGSGRKPGYGGRGGTIYLPYTTMVLEVIRRRHTHSTPLQPGWLLPWPSEHYQPLHTFHDRKGVRRSAPLPWKPTEQSRRWLHQHLCVL